MSTKTTQTIDRALLERAHNLMSGILQYDYLSNGRGHKRLRKLNAAKRTEHFPILREPEPSDVAEQTYAGEPRHAVEDEDDLENRPAPSSTKVASDDHHYAGRKTCRNPFPPLESSEEYCLVRAARGGSTKARDKLVLHNLSLVEMIARRFAKFTSMQFDDLVAEGNFGLFEAIKRFDPEYGYRFASYAKWWVRQSIEAAVMTQSRVVRLPAHVNRELRKARSAGDSDAIKRFASCLLKDVSYVDSQNDETEPLSVLDSIAADEASSPEFALSQQKQFQCLAEALNSLCEDDQRILRERFGIDRDEPMTLQDVAQRMGLSGERVRQIQARATSRLHTALKARGGC